MKPSVTLSRSTNQQIDQSAKRQRGKAAKGNAPLDAQNYDAGQAAPQRTRLHADKRGLASSSGVQSAKSRENPRPQKIYQTIRRYAPVLPLAFVLLAVWGYWAPWVAHKTAALTLIGWDLGEYVKFLGEVRAGELVLLRELFYLPPLCAALVLLLLASDYTRRTAMILRSIILIGAGLLILTILPFFQPPFSYYFKSLLTAEHRGQALMVAIGGLASCLFPLWSLLGYIPRRVLIITLAIAGAVGASWQFWRTIPALNHVYGKPITVGWGLWVMIGGFGGMVLVAGVELVRGNEHVSK